MENKLGPVIIKLLTLWVMDSDHESPRDISSNWISHGIWETKGVEEKLDGIGRPCRIYDFVCVSSYHKDRKVGDKARMSEEQILWLCHEVKIVHQPKINKEVEVRDIKIDSIIGESK